MPRITATNIAGSSSSSSARCSQPWRSTSRSWSSRFARCEPSRMRRQRCGAATPRHVYPIRCWPTVTWRAWELAALVISQAESDHARISHELHESAAQRLAAQVMQISAIARSTTEAHTKVQLEELREVTAETLEQVRLLVRTMNAPVVHAWPEAADLDDEHASNPAERDALAGRG